MTDVELAYKVREASVLLQTLSVHLNNYEQSIPNKEQQIRVLNAKIAEVSEQLRQEQTRGGSFLANASDEASKLRKDAEDTMARACRMLDEAKAAKAQADASISEAKQRATKLEVDERAFKTSQQIFDRKKAALEKALGE